MFELFLVATFVLFREWDNLDRYLKISSLSSDVEYETILTHSVTFHIYFANARVYLRLTYLTSDWPIYHIYPTPRLGQDMTQQFNRFEFRVPFSETSCFNKAEEPSLSYYLTIAGGRIIGFIPFPRVLVQCEMQSVSSRIWTRVAESISYDDNHYTTGNSNPDWPIYISTISSHVYSNATFHFNTCVCWLKIRVQINRSPSAHFST